MGYEPHKANQRVQHVLESRLKQSSGYEELRSPTGFMQGSHFFDFIFHPIMRNNKINLRIQNKQFVSVFAGFFFFSV